MRSPELIGDTTVLQEYYGDFDVGLPRWMDASKEVLKKKFSVDDLSIIELVRLRYYVRDAIDRWSTQLPLHRSGELSSGSVIDIECEAAYTWLVELYDVDWPVIRSEIQGRKTASEEFRTWLSVQRCLSHLL